MNPLQVTLKQKDGELIAVLTYNLQDLSYRMVACIAYLPEGQIYGYTSMESEAHRFGNRKEATEQLHKLWGERASVICVEGRCDDCYNF